MAWPLRVGLFAFGLFLALVGKTQLDAGHWVFLNATYRQTTFAAGAYGVGAVFCLLAFLPPDNWMYRHITTRLPMRDNLRPWPRRRKCQRHPQSL